MDQPGSAPLDAESPTDSVGRILLVDDEEGVRRWVKYILEEDGHQVSTANSVRSAVDLLGSAYDAVILDVDLPDGQGFDVVDALRACQSSLTPVVMISGNPSQENLGKSLASGIVEFLFKPFNTTELREAVARSLETKGRWDERVSALQDRGSSPPEEPEAIPGASFPPSEVTVLVETLSHCHGLTERERETLGLMLAGLPNADIAEALKISANTVKYHVRNVLTKIGMESRTELFRSLLNQGD